MMTDFKGAQVKDTRFGGAYLHGADLSQAVDLTPAQVDDIYADENTRFPGHFPPPPRADNA